MKSRLLPALVGPLALVAAAVLVPSAGASTDAGTAASIATDKPVYWIDLGGHASRHPDYVFFTANGGPYVKHLTWSHWGDRKTIGRGTFGTTAPCDPNGSGPEGGGPPCPDGPAKIVMRKPVRCTPEFGSKEGKKVRVYRHATIWYPDGEGNTVRANISDRTGWAVCKQSD